MKYLKLLTILTLLLPTFTHADFQVNLKYGAKGDEVRELQEFLISEGHLTGIATGNFYSLTLKAVKEFQRVNNLPVTGYFGSMSRAIANQILAIDADNTELQELGSISSPVDTTLDKKIEDLNKKIEQQNAIIEAQKQLQTQTNQILGEIKTNTNKVMPEPTQPTQPVVQTPPVVETPAKRYDKTKVSLIGDYFITNGERGRDTIYNLKPSQTYTARIELLDNFGDNFPLDPNSKLKISNSVNKEEVILDLATNTVEYTFTSFDKSSDPDKGSEAFYFFIDSQENHYSATLRFLIQ